MVQAAAGLHRVMGGNPAPQALLVAGLASDQAKLLRWRLEQVVLPNALLRAPERAQELHTHVALAEELHKQLRHLATQLVATTLPDPHSKDTRTRARALVESGPLSPTYFATAERELGGVMALIAADQLEEADALWHRTLRSAALTAWHRVLSGMGHSPRALKAEAQCSPLLHGALHKHLPAAYAAASTPIANPEEA